MIQIGFHTDAFNSAYWNFEQCLQWAQRNRVEYIECGTIDGVSWIHGLGYQPHIALWEDPLLLRKKMDDYGRPVLADGRGIPAVAAGRSDLGRRVYPAHHPLGQAGRAARASTPPTTASSPRG